MRHRSAPRAALTAILLFVPFVLLGRTDASVLRYTSPVTTNATRITLRAEGARLVIVDDDSGQVVASSLAAATRRVEIRGADGDHNDTLTVDLTRPFTIPDGIDYDGGAGGWDTLVLSGGTTAHETIAQRSKSDGVITLDGMTIRYTNLEPLTDTVASATLTLTGTAGNDAISMTDGPIVAGQQTTTISAPTFESYTFANKTELDLRGGGGTDSLTINNPNPAAGLTTLTLNAIQTIAQTGPLVVPNFLLLDLAGSPTTTLTNAANAILNVAVTTSGGAYTLTSSVALTSAAVTSAAEGVTSFGIFTAGGPISLTSTVAITLNQSVNAGISAVSLTAPSLAGPAHALGGPLSFTDSSAIGKTWAVGPSLVQMNAAAPILLASPTGVTVTGGTGSDTFSVFPSTTVPFTIDGNNPPPPALPGDTLLINTGGLTTPHLTFTSTPAGFQGVETFGNAAPVAFSRIESGTVPTHFSVTAPASATAGSAFLFTVTALDSVGNPVVGYSGTVHFTTSDPLFVLPADTTLTNGTGTFSATLRTVGTQTITATDTVTPSITGTSNPIAVSAGAATHFVVTAPATATAGSAFNFTVTALDQFNNTATGYAGIVHFTSSDAQAVLPANSTLASGTGTFSATLKTAGNQTITATDTGAPSVTGTSNAIAVSATAATHFSVSAPPGTTGGSAFSFTVTALDAFNNTATGYTGIVHFTSSDAQAVLPGNATLTSGVGTFSATLKTGGNQTITATDTVTSSITGTSNPIGVVGGAATHFSVTLPATATAGSAFNFTVTALDAFNNTAIEYTGIVHFTSSDGLAVLPADSTLTAGTGTFSATLKTAGVQTITATDTVASSITGTGTTTVSGAAATHFAVSAPATASANVAFNFTVTALDQFNNTATGYAGIVHFTSSDALAVLPANATLAAGTGTFSATLRTVGNQTITATDTVTASITGTSNAITVTSVAATHFSVSAPATAIAGTAFSFTVTALDALNNTVTGYTGTVHFTSTDAQAVLPADATLTSGIGTFSATLRTAGNRTITATDTVTPSITGTSNPIAVGAGAATHFSLTAPSSATEGATFSFTVTALDAFNNIASGYAGTLHFTSSDALATLPANATLTNGTGTFSARLATAGNQTITAADTVNAAIAGAVTVAVVAAIPALSAAILLLLAGSLAFIGALKMRG